MSGTEPLPIWTPTPAFAAASVIADQSPKASPIVATCDGPRTRIYCLFDDDSLERYAETSELHAGNSGRA